MAQQTPLQSKVLAQPTKTPQVSLVVKASEPIWTLWNWVQTCHFKRRPWETSSSLMRQASFPRILTSKKSTWYTMTTSVWWPACTKNWSIPITSSSRNCSPRSSEAHISCGPKLNSCCFQAWNLLTKPPPLPSHLKLKKNLRVAVKQLAIEERTTMLKKPRTRKRRNQTMMKIRSPSTNCKTLEPSQLPRATRMPLI